MLSSFPVALIVGCALGILAGLGVGGGSLLILWLTLVLKIGHQDAGSINLLFFIPSAIIASFFRWKQGHLNLKQVLPAMIAACISAGVCSALRNYISFGYLEKFFGLLLLLTGLREVFYRPRKDR